MGVLDMRLTKPQTSGAQAVAIPGADAAWIDDGCTTSVGPCFNIDVVVGDKTLQVTGGTSREQTIAIAKKVLSVA